MTIESTLRRLLEIGRSGQYAELARIAELQSHVSVLRLADVHRDEILSFATNLPRVDRIAFIKSIAMLEDGVGGLGSVTTLERLLPLVPDRERKLLDWILRNTESYSYYSHGARSAEELDLMLWHIAEHRAERVEKDQTRQIEDRGRIAAEATTNLYNAVRRGDLKAVRALIKKGADATSCAPDGSSLISIAMSNGFEAIAAELRHASDHKAAP